MRESRNPRCENRVVSGWGKVAPRDIRVLTSRLSLRERSEGVCVPDPTGTSSAVLSVSASSMAMASTTPDERVPSGDGLPEGADISDKKESLWRYG